MIKRLVHGRTHVCWTPDNNPAPDKVSLVRESDLATLEERLTRLETALGAISGFANIGHVAWYEKYPVESLRIRNSDDPCRTICDIAYEALTK